MASTDDSPLAQPHWHTRKQGKLPDDVWTQTECLLEKAEMALEPFSPGAQSDTCENEMLANCTNPEYLRLLAVARGEREPDEEDEEDADFVPEFEDEDGEGARGHSRPRGQQTQQHALRALRRTRGPRSQKGSP